MGFTLILYPCYNIYMLHNPIRYFKLIYPNSWSTCRPTCIHTQHILGVQTTLTYVGLVVL